VATLIYWEQRAFLLVNIPFTLLGTFLLLLLSPIYFVLGLLRLPLLLLLLLMSVVFALLVGVISLLSKISQRLPVLRPLVFVIALPLLILAHFLVSISPAPGSADAEAKYVKWVFIEEFPYGTLLQNSDAA
jgi:hypothetical protein